MNEKEYINSSEKLLHTDIMVLMGGKSAFDQNLIEKQVNVTPPPIIIELTKDGDDGNNRLPELINSNVNEVLNKPPSWLIRWGVSVFFLVFVLIIGTTWFVEYPDLVGSPLTVMANNMPKTVNYKAGGRLTKLMVKDGDMVTNGQVLAYLESVGSHEEVLELEKTVNKLIGFAAVNNVSGIHATNVPLLFNLGELQKSYQGFQEMYVRSRSSKSNGVYYKKKNTIGGEINTLRHLQSNTRDQLEIQEKDLELALQDLKSQERLSEKGYVSKIDAKNAYSKYLNKKQALEQAKSAIDNNYINQSQKQQEIIELEKTIEEQKNGLVQSINALKSDIEAWKKNFIAIASANGKVNFLSSIQENQMIPAGKDLLYILPEGSGFYGQMMLGQYNFGKVKVGQEVIVKFQSFPFQEYGTVKGKVSYISDIPKDSTYMVKIGFPDGLITSSKKKLPFRNGMTAQGDIITENLKLMEKFFYDIRKSMKR